MGIKERITRLEQKAGGTGNFSLIPEQMAIELRMMKFTELQTFLLILIPLDLRVLVQPMKNTRRPLS